MKKIIYAILGVVFFAACNKDDNTEDIDPGADQGAPQFEVTTAKTTYNVGETVTFNISGDAGLLDFWSGEFGNNYDYREGRVLPGPNEVLMEFRMRDQYRGERTASTLSVLVSTDFEGDRTVFEEVNAATWTDITDRFEFAGDAQTNSGKIDIGEFRDGTKPLHIAFKYVFDPELGDGRGTWPQFTWMTVEAVTGEENILLSGELTSDFPKYSAGSIDKNPIQSLNRYYNPDQSSNALVIQRNSNVTVDGITYTDQTYTEEYFVSVPYEVGETELDPDQPEALTSLSEPTISSHTHTFSQPGVYKVIFIGTDPSLTEDNETIKELEITVIAPAD